MGAQTEPEEKDTKTKLQKELEKESLGVLRIQAVWRLKQEFEASLDYGVRH